MNLRLPFTAALLGGGAAHAQIVDTPDGSVANIPANYTTRWRSYQAWLEHARGFMAEHT